MGDILITDIIDGLDDIGYSGIIKDETSLRKAASEGASSHVFTTLVSYLTCELHYFYGTTEFVNPTKKTEDAQNFSIEMSGFLSEYGCPFGSLTSGDLSVRFHNCSNCLSLLWFLISELQAAKMFHFHNPSASQEKEAVVGRGDGTDFFENLKCVCVTLKMSKPPDDISLQKFFVGVTKKILDVMKGKEANIGTPVIKYAHDSAYWKQMTEINEALTSEYKLRRSMLLKRVDVTISSFTWSDQAKAKLDDIAEVYQKIRHTLSATPKVTIASLLAAREDIYQILKTSSGTTRHQCAINKVKIGKVPDRGGRPDECEPPPPEMPSWQKRQPDNFRGRGGRGGSYDNRGQNFRGGYDQRSYSGGHHSGGYSQHPPNGGFRGGHDQRPQSGRGGRGGQSRWGRGRGGHANDGGTFEQYYGHGGQSYNRGGFGSGRQVYSS